MQFLMIICHDKYFISTNTLIAEILEWNNAMNIRKIRRYGHTLAPARDGMTVRIRKGKRMLKKGSFTASKEKIAAYELIECENFDEAVDVASTHPMARFATIEVRPVQIDLTI